MDNYPKQIGPYRIEEEIGRGGTATVYRALDTRPSVAHETRRVALKVLLPQFTTDSTVMQRFKREGKNASQLQHENIVRVYEADSAHGFFYIAMELVEGCTLSEYLVQREEILHTTTVLDILSQIAAGLDFAHSLGFLHRDIKLGNILMTGDGRALLSDFGAAKHMYSDNTIVTAVGHTIGTPSYMSPEQVTGLEVGPHSDVYSLGVIAYKLFTGRLPFRAHNQPELLHKIAYEQPPAPDIINPELPVHIVNALIKALRKDPEQRYESAGMFVASMVAGQVWRMETLDRKPDTATIADASAVRHRRARVYGAAAALAAVLVAAIVFFSPGGLWRDGLRTYGDDVTTSLTQSAAAAVPDVRARAGEFMPQREQIIGTMVTASGYTEEDAELELAYWGALYEEWRLRTQNAYQSTTEWVDATWQSASDWVAGFNFELN